MKIWTLVGVPKVVGAVVALAGVEGRDDAVAGGTK